MLGTLLLVKVLDLGFRTVFDRAFDPVGDWAYLGPGVGVLGDSIGDSWARVVAVVAGVLTLAVLVGVPLAVVRLVRVTARRPRAALTGAAGFGALWVVCLAIGVESLPGTPVASTSATALAVDEVRLVRGGLADWHRFAREIDTDQVADEPAEQTLAGLRGKDVLLVFVESYGRVAVQDSSFAPGDPGGARCRDGPAREGGLSGPQRLPDLTDLRSGQLAGSLHAAVRALGRQPAALPPAARRGPAHPDPPLRGRRLADGPRRPRQHGGLARRGRLLRRQRYYDSRNVGYAGPSFGYAPMPDQYTLSEFRRRELSPPDRPPVMAEIDLVSSHHPWTPLPRLVDWDQVGDGSVFDGMPEQGQSSDEVFQDPDAVKRAYGASVEYSWRTLVSFLTTNPDPDLVLVVLGDHQPHTYVSGQDAGHDVPVTVIAQDPDVIRRISGWDWQEGLRPDPEATVWRMDAFRDRFLAAFD